MASCCILTVNVQTSSKTENFYQTMRCLWIMLVTAVCFLVLVKLKWPKNKNIYDIKCILSERANHYKFLEDFSNTWHQNLKKIG